MATASILAGGCSNEGIDDAKVQQNPPYFETEELRTLADQFMIEGIGRGVAPDFSGLSVVMVDEIPCDSDCKTEDGVIAGNCQYAFNTVHLSRKTWGYFSNDEHRQKMWRFEITAHELAHCVLHRPHYSGPMRSIMNPVLPKVTDFIKFYDDYMDELFRQDIELVGDEDYDLEDQE